MSDISRKYAAQACATYKPSAEEKKEKFFMLTTATGRLYFSGKKSRLKKKAKKLWGVHLPYTIKRIKLI